MNNTSFTIEALMNATGASREWITYKCQELTVDKKGIVLNEPYVKSLIMLWGLKLDREALESIKDKSENPKEQTDSN